jgi:16S rRNA (guanine(527)-N(7))-methyltransferase RsmG
LTPARTGPHHGDAPHVVPPRQEAESAPMNPSRASLQAIIEGCGVRLRPEQFDKLWAYHRMLRAANPELNLTRIHNFENMVLKHYVDSLLVLNLEELPSPLIDMGSGPGLPGIPLKIARPDLAMILAEPRGARAEFLQEVCDRLGLEDIEVYAGKIGPRYDRRVAGVITRAVATIPETLDRVANCLRPGGRMLFMKGPDCDDEIAEARRSHAGSFRPAADHAYEIPGTTHRRRLVVYERLEGEVAGVSEPSSRHEGPIRDVTSESNPTFRLARDLLHGKGIRKHGQALLAGARIVAEVLERHPENALGWVTGGEGPPPPSPGLMWLRMSESLFRQLDVSGTHAPLLLARVPAMPAWSGSEGWPEGCTLFVPFQDPENVGAVIRSAAAFGAARVVLLRESAHPFHPRASRAAGSALFQVPLMTGPSIGELSGGDVPLIALSADGEAIASKPWPERFGLVPGVEGPGLPEHLRGGGVERRRIPIAEGVESLNAAVATAVALYEWRRGDR